MAAVRIVKSGGEQRAITNVWGFSDRLAKKRALARVSASLKTPPDELRIVNISGIFRRRVVVAMK